MIAGTSPLSFLKSMSIIFFLNSYTYTLLFQVVFQIGNTNFAIMKNACSQSCIAFPYLEGVAKIFHAAGSSRCHHRNGTRGGESRQLFVGKTFLNAIVIHTCKENFSCAALLCFFGPLIQVAFSCHSPSIEIAKPFSVIFHFCINGDDANLRTKMKSDFIDEFRSPNGCRIDADFVCSCAKHSLYISEFVDSTAYGERDRYFCCYSAHHIGESLSSFKTCGNIEKNEFVSIFFTIFLAQFNR